MHSANVQIGKIVCVLQKLHQPRRAQARVGHNIKDSSRDDPIENGEICEPLRSSPHKVFAGLTRSCQGPLFAQRHRCTALLHFDLP